MNALCCLYCGEPNVVLGMDEDHEFACTACDGSWTREDAKERVEAWVKTLAWIETSPFLGAKPKASGVKVA